MKKIVLLAFVLVLLSTAVVVRFTSPVAASLPVHNIDTGLNYSTIQEAINAPETLDGHTILVEEGNYTENVNVNKSLTIKSEVQAERTIVQATNSNFPVFKVTVDYVNISGFAVEGSFSYVKSTYIGVGAVLIRVGGIQLESCEYCNMFDNICFNNSIGIHLLESGNNTIYENECLNNEGTGIYLNWYSHRNTVLRNKCILNDFGVFLEDSKNNIVKENECSENLCGVSLYSSQSSESHLAKNNIIMRNTISNNEEGICLYASCQNIIKENNVSHNRYGIAFYYDNKDMIYHNNFVNNTDQVETLIGGEYGYNRWDDGYPSGGNYWGDYKDRYPDAEEIDESGIWDTPYVIDENNQDNYPLMNPWTPEEEEEEIPFWMQWWFWTIVAAGIVALAGAIYFLKKRKPPTPTAPALPIEGTLENTTQNTNPLEQ